MADKIKVFALGGLDETGKNLYIVEINGDIFVLDCGLKYPDNNIPGVDAIIPNFDYLKANKERVKAYFVSHAHDDKMGALPYIYREVPAPIVTSLFTAKRLEEYSKKIGFKNKYKFDYVEKPGFKMVAGHKCHFNTVTHSVPFSLSFSIYTDQGAISYTSDYIFDFTNLPPEFKMSSDTLINASSDKTLLLLSDSTCANKPGHASPGYQITSHILDYFENSEGRIYFAVYNQNIINLNEVMGLARKYNKTVIFADKDVGEEKVKLYNQFSQTPNTVKIETLENLNRLRDKDVVVILTGEGSNLFDKIISFANNSFSNKLIEFNPKDTFIFDCPAVAATEILATQALDEVYKTACQVVSFTRKTINSLHAHEEDIKTLISLKRPKYYMPICGSFANLMANAKIALAISKCYNYSNIFVVDNGMVVNIDDGIAKVNYKETIQTGNVMIDGTDIGNIGNNVIEERNKLSNDGVVIMGVTVSSKKQEIIGGPDVQMRGFVFLKESENILHNVTDLFLDQVRIYLTGYTDENQTTEEKIVEKITRYLRRETGKTPVIIPAIIDIDK